MSICEVVDRWSICKLKFERIGGEAEKEYLDLDKEMKIIESKYPDIHWDFLKKNLYDINGFLWDCESGLKSGKEKLPNAIYLFDKDNEEALRRIGTATIIIRTYNHLRVSFKNYITDLVNQGYKDIKINHLSQ